MHSLSHTLRMSSAWVIDFSGVYGQASGHPETLSDVAYFCGVRQRCRPAANRSFVDFPPTQYPNSLLGPVSTADVLAHRALHVSRMA